MHRFTRFLTKLTLVYKQDRPTSYLTELILLITSIQAHTMYQVGLMETDQHIEFFWAALEMFTQEELCKFIKFACNQERIPFTCPCKDGGPDTAHVPPYPMKIAPPDGAAGECHAFIVDMIEVSAGQGQK